MPFPECGPGAHYYSGEIYKFTPDHGSDFFVNAPTDEAVAGGTTYSWSVTVTEETIGGTSSVGVFDIIRLSDNAEVVSVVFTTTGTWTGSFTPGGGNTLRARLSVLHNDIRGADATVEFFLDPAGWTPPDCPDVEADFSGTPTSGDAPLTVDFTDETTNGPTSWAWDFGDGGTSTEQNPEHVYTTPGVYTVSLTASSASSEDTETKVGYIIVRRPGGAIFS
jgi:PKD repeat protein